MDESTSQILRVIMLVWGGAAFGGWVAGIPGVITGGLLGTVFALWHVFGCDRP